MGGYERHGRTGAPRILWWLRRDLRLSDNLTLHHALRNATSVVPVFILDPVLLKSDRLAPARRQFLFDSLVALDRQLRERDSRLILRAGDPGRELTKLAQEVGAQDVYFHADITPFARKRDMRVSLELAGAGIKVQTVTDAYLAAPTQVLKQDGSPYTVYTAYRRRFERVVSLPPRYDTQGLLHTPAGIPSLSVDESLPPRDLHFAPGGEQKAQRLLRSFLSRRDGLGKYLENRNFPGLDATSHLSPHVHFGTISPRELMRAARAMETMAGAVNVDLWASELIWREFFAQVLWHFPHAAQGSFRREYDDLEWENDKEKYAAWCDGRTGYPIVDAAMRQLNQTGWMHNRARMIVASFLTKDLLVDWRWGERYFMQRLVDGDLAANNGGWQWAAGTGTDAQPYFRIFNPIEQGRRYDPDGDYVRRWIPELAAVPADTIHTPWTAPAARGAPANYPAPIVDHSVQRAQAIALYGRRQEKLRR